MITVLNIMMTLQTIKLMTISNTTMTIETITNTNTTTNITKSNLHTASSLSSMSARASFS